MANRMTPQALDIEITPDDHLNIGNMFAIERKWGKAMHFYQQALTIRPGDPNCLTSLALAQLKGGLTGQASDNINRALLAQKDYPFAWNVGGMVDEEKGNWVSAEDSFKRAIAIMPDNPAFLMNLAHLYQILGRYPESEAQYDKAITLDPTNLEARFYKSMTVLTQGRFDTGAFSEYEVRYALYDCPVPKNGHTIWRGQEPLAGKKVLMCGDQGLGDNIMCARYATWLKTHHGAREVVVIGKKEILPVLACCRDVDGIVYKWEDAEPYDFHVAMMSLPGLALTQLVNAGGDVVRGQVIRQPWYGGVWKQYMRSLPEMDRHVMSTSDPGRGKSDYRLKVGFCWAGNKDHGNDKYRSLKGSQFDTLILPKMIPVSLQYNDINPRMADFPASSVFELAQTIQGLDLVVTVDTLVAHLAGALGKPTWVLISSNPDWRWGLSGETTPWYPSMRLFRAAKPLEWGPVIGRVREALENLLDKV